MYLDLRKRYWDCIRYCSYIKR